ncbi:hypothetical protein KPH14_004904 [Odynerus spinipes]|uniref:Protein MIS12 homolog n=1 Tax=Odynerus spinipes TaxID=1348599 RepID=A0AAD9VQS0_9HYME|nr:hypothetical protein KPH14_004904 [Odynerus spinipes]
MADSTELETRREEEYEMQLLGFHSRAVYATLESIVQETIKSKCKKLCKTLQTKYDSNPEKLRELEEVEKQLIQIYCTRAIPHLKNIESTIKKFIFIPKHVLLKEDKCQRTQYTDEEFQKLQEHLKDLQQRAKRATIINAAVKEELSTVDQLQSCIAKNNTMCDITENSFPNLDTNRNMLTVLEYYKEFHNKLSCSLIETQKEKYNPFENIEGEICDFDSL